MTLKREVLNCFKKLHKTRKLIFTGDQRALNFVRKEINLKFHENKSICDESEIRKLITQGIEVEHELRTTVIQAKEVNPGVYEARILPDTMKFDNVEYNAAAVENAIKMKKQNKNMNKCCNNTEKSS